MKIANIVTLWDYGKPIGITNPMKDFNASVLKTGQPTLLTFASGKIVATGCTTLKQARTVVRNHFSGSKYIRIVNMTASAFLKSKPDIENLPGVTYEPELFPAYLWRKSDSQLCVVYYKSGKLIITGAKSHKELRRTYCEFKELIGIKSRANVNKS